MTAITYDGAVPTVGADADVWGTELNVGALAKIKADLDMLNAAPTNTILGRNDSGTGQVERLTPTEVVNMIPVAALIARLGTGAVRVAGGFLTVSSTAASITSGMNLASVTWSSITASEASVAVVFTVAMSNANYQVQLTAESPGNSVPPAPHVNSLTRTVNGFTFIYDKTICSRIDLSVFAG